MTIQSNLLPKSDFKLQSILVLMICILCVSCDDDEEDDDSPTPTGQSEYFDVTFDGNTYSSSDPMVTVSGDAIEVTVNYSSSVAAELAFSEPLSEGSYSTNSERGFAFVDGNDAWFSGTSCTIEITDYDAGSKYMKGEVSGTVQDLFGTTTATLTEARFAFSFAD